MRCRVLQLYALRNRALASGLALNHFRTQVTRVCAKVRAYLYGGEGKGGRQAIHRKAAPVRLSLGKLLLSLGRHLLLLCLCLHSQYPVSAAVKFST